jgi:hypothetical protein
MRTAVAIGLGIIISSSFFLAFGIYVANATGNILGLQLQFPIAILLFGIAIVASDYIAHLESRKIIQK